MEETEILRCENIVNYFINNKDLIGKLSKQEQEDIMGMSSYILTTRTDDRLKSKILTIVYDIAFIDDISLEDCWQIYWNIVSQLFRNNNICLLRGDVETLYDHIFDSLQNYLKLDYQYQELENRNSDTIIIITSQFIDFNHAPTRRVLDYSYTIQKYLKKKVIIINDSGFNFYQNDHFINTFSPNFKEDYSHINTLPYKDEEFEFYQVDSNMPNLLVITKLLDIIYEINPLFIFNIGGSSLVVDLCTAFTTTVSLPCSFQIPISRAKYLLVGRKANEKDAERISRMMDYQCIIETLINYNIVQCEQVYSRKQFGLSEDSFVISIVGNRLDDEISIDFLQLINKIVKIKKIHILFIGAIYDTDRIVKVVKSKENLHFLGSISGASEVMKLTNIYLNPERNGGGRSSFEAIYHGVPVITLKTGDVFHTCGNEFGVSDYKEMYDLTIKHYTDIEFHQEMKNKGIQRARKLNDIYGTQKSMIENIIRLESR